MYHARAPVVEFLVLREIEEHVHRSRDELYVGIVGEELLGNLTQFNIHAIRTYS